MMPKLTFKWSRKKQCIYIDKKNPKTNVAKVTAAKYRHRLIGVICNFSVGLKWFKNTSGFFLFVCF